MNIKFSLLALFFLFTHLICLAQGKFQWLKHPVSIGDENGNAVYEDRFGYVYSVGCFSDTLVFAGQTFIAQGVSTNALILKYDSAGNEIWARIINSNGEGYCVGIQGDSIGNIYVLGTFDFTAQFGPFTLTANYYDGFLCKLDSGGNFQWVFQMSSSYFTHARDFKIDVSGNTYITGSYSRSLSFGGIVLPWRLDSDIFLGKVNSNGQAVWAHRAGCDGSGNKHDYGFGIDIDSYGNSYITGAFRDTADFGTFTLISKGEEDIYVAKYDSIGNIIWAKRAGKGSSYGDFGTAISIRNDTSIFLIGDASKDSDFGTLTFQTPYTQTTFIAEIDSNGNFKRVKSLSYTSTPGWQIGRGKKLFINQSGESFIVANPEYPYQAIGSYQIWGMSIIKLDSLFNVVWVKPFRDIGGIYYNQKSIFYCGGFTGPFQIDQYNLTSTGADILIGKINDASNRITGRVFQDIDGDTIYTFGDVPILMDSINISPFNIYLVSDSSGLWEATIDTGSFSLNNIIPLGYSQVKPLPNLYPLSFPFANQTMVDLDFVLVSQTGILENQNENSFQVYPNPFRSIISIIGTKIKGEIILHNIMGQEILCQKTDEGATKLNTENLSSGLYLLQYFNGKTTANFKVTKQ